MFIGQFIFPCDPECDFNRLYDELVMNGIAKVFNVHEISEQREAKNEDTKQ